MLSVGLLVWNHDSGQTAGLANQDFAQLAMAGTLLATLLVGGAWYRGTVAGTLRNAALWLAIFLGLGFLYQVSPALQAMFNG
ncbi:MAG: hypothetical protein HC788_10345 [Sphingopyxis sp.]|nr:hypothetical protein [Sphingopyxis sp.]